MLSRRRMERRVIPYSIVRDRGSRLRGRPSSEKVGLAPAELRLLFRSALRDGIRAFGIRTPSLTGKGSRVRGEKERAVLVSRTCFLAGLLFFDPPDLLPRGLPDLTRRA